jgi:hypothetical protein
VPSDDAAKPPLKIGKTRLISMDDLDRRTTVAQATLETKEAIIAEVGGLDALSKWRRCTFWISAACQSHLIG